MLREHPGYAKPHVADMNLGPVGRVAFILQTISSNGNCDAADLSRDKWLIKILGLVICAAHRSIRIISEFSDEKLNQGAVGQCRAV